MQSAWLCAGNESHAGQTFTCVAALAIANALHYIDTDLLCWWCVAMSVDVSRAWIASDCPCRQARQGFSCRLCERQTPSGGLNGRPEKLEDVRNLSLVLLLTGVVSMLLQMCPVGQM